MEPVSKRKIVYSIIEFISGFKVTDDSPYDEELIGKKVDDVRAMLIRQEWTEKRKISDAYYQKAKVTIEEEPISDDIALIEFYVTFPELLSGVGWYDIKYLGRATLKYPYNRRNITGFGVRQARRWTSKEVDYMLESSTKAVIRYEKMAEKIVMFALFKTPDSVPGFSWDSEYPVSEPFRLEMIVKQDIAAALGIPADEINDARHNREQLTGQMPTGR